MPDLLLEFYSEEIPARMQRDAADGLKSLLCETLSISGISCGDASAYATPRRVCIVIKGLPEFSPVQKKEKRGPSKNATQEALSGFLRSTGLTENDLKLRKEKKGQYYFVVLEDSGQTISKVVAEAVTSLMRKFVWPKSMIWGTKQLRWVRPLHSILCILHDENDCWTVDFEIEGIRSGNTTRGHRFMSPSEFKVNSFDDYRAKLMKTFVVLDSEDRKKRIRDRAEQLAEKKGLNLVDDPELLDENAGLTEWPVPMIGAIEDRFLDLPNELLTAAMKQHQKYHSAVDPDSGKVSHFVMVANKETKDDGEAMLAGNLRVLNSRLEDAEFYWKNDLRTIRAGGSDGNASLVCRLKPLEEKLRHMNFHRELGNMEQRVSRISAISERLAEIIPVTFNDARLAARLSKIDLVTETVKEFPELQGKVGRKLALLNGVETEIANACDQHYSPAGPSDSTPSESLAIIVGLADRIDYLAGFFGIGETPSGSKDPHGLKRAAIGVIRLILDNSIRIQLRETFDLALGQYARESDSGSAFDNASRSKILKKLLGFMHERLAVYLRTAGIRNDWINACVSASDADDLILLKKRAISLGNIVQTDDGINLVKAFKRVNNILASEEKKGEIDLQSRPERQLCEESEERTLLDDLESTRAHVSDLIKAEDFPLAAKAVAELRPSIDNFFDHVLVNSPSPELRQNRLRLLNEIRATCLQIADLTRIET